MYAHSLLASGAALFVVVQRRPCFFLRSKHDLYRTSSGNLQKTFNKENWYINHYLRYKLIINLFILLCASALFWQAADSEQRRSPFWQVDCWTSDDCDIFIYFLIWKKGNKFFVLYRWSTKSDIVTSWRLGVGFQCIPEKISDITQCQRSLQSSI